MACVLDVCISEIRGIKKHTVPYIDLKLNYGIVGDSHAGDWHRQISMLANESVDKMRTSSITLNPGDFAENILTQGIELNTLPVGTVLRIGDTKVKVTQIGKKCHNDCDIKKLVGKCVMPTEGIFVIVLKEGRVQKGDLITICEDYYEDD